MAKIGTVLKKPERDRVEEKHPRMSINWIHYSKLVRSAYQFYGEDDEEVKALADVICADGRVLQNLLVRKVDADEYEIVAGHKRTLACRYLTEVYGLKEYEFLPCMVTDANDVRARWQVMTTNHHHEKTQYEIMKEIEDMKYLMETYPEEFPNEALRGRMVERLAKELHLSRSVVSDYQSISHNLVDEGKEAFKEQKIDKSAAVALASLPEQEQKKLLDAGNVTHTSVKEYKKTLSGQIMIQNTDMELKEEIAAETHIVDDYKTWEIWAENKLAEEIFYIKDLGAQKVIVRSTKTKNGDMEDWYIWQEGKYLADCAVSKEKSMEVLNEKAEFKEE